jgi:alpha-mannosidase
VGPTRIFLVPHTHWDREWYMPFEDFLSRLVEMMDGLIELLDREPGFAHFHLDGQAAMIDDYLEVRPEREPDIRRLARAGRISVGPWYTQMDEFLVSGESLIRNLEWGLARARDLAGEQGPEAVGYLPDQFGHIGQMPQILWGAGVARAVVWRGVPASIERTPFRWEAPDGSAVQTEYLAFGYGAGWRLTQCGDPETLAAELSQAVEWLAPFSLRDRLLITVGGDHHVPAARLPPLLEEVNRRASPADRAEIGSLDRFLDGPDPPELPSWRGELRSAARAPLLPGVYSTRIPQKHGRAGVEALVERYAEPLAALVPGFEWPEGELREAWRLLLWNGAHDSVCGCSVDQVARDVDARYERAEAIARELVERAMDALASRISRPGWMHFNPSPFERYGVPGLGWKLDAEVPFRQPVPFDVEDGGIRAGGFTLRLVDEGDVGDLYNFCPTDAAPAVEPSGFAVRGDVLEARFEGLTVELHAERQTGGEAVSLGGTIRNERPDHRLRMHVTLPAPVTRSTAIAPFEVVQRRLVSEGGVETPSPVWPARGAVLAGSIAVFQQGVFEYEVQRAPAELAVTLLRCVGTISRPEIATRAWAAGPDIPTPDAQMIGEHRFRVTLQRGIAPEHLPSAWERSHLPLRARRASGGGNLPEAGSLLSIDGAQLSSVRRVDGDLRVRVWNPSTERREVRVGDRTLVLEPAGIESVGLAG